MKKLEHYRGDALPIRVKLTGHTLTGWKISITVKTRIDQDNTDSAAVLSLGPSVATLADVAAESFLRSFSTATMALVPAGNYLLDVQLHPAAGAAVGLVAGDVITVPPINLVILPDVTRRVS